MSCLEPETVAAYVEGRLSAGARAAVHSHLAQCDSCTELVAETVHADEALDLSAGVSETRKQRGRVLPFSSRAVRVGVSLLAAAAALLVVVRVFWPTEGARNRVELQQLAAALESEPTRLIEGRLAGPFKYAPPLSPTRSGVAREPSPDVRIAVANLEKNETRSPADTAAAGAGYLIAGDVDRAVATLEEAAGRDPLGTQIQTDLAAAYVARGMRQNSPEDLARAVDASDRAIRLDPAASAAWFNRALALEQLRGGSAAREAWQEYLNHETVPEWRAEAEQRLKAIGGGPVSWSESTPLRLASASPETVLGMVKTHPAEARIHVSDALLPAWGAHTLDGRSDDAAATLSVAEAIAIALDEGGGDPMLRTVAAQIRSASASGRDEWARGFTAWGEARRLYTQDKVAESARHFAAAERAFSGVGSGFQHWSDFYAGIAEYYSGRFDAALGRFTSVIDYATSHGYAALLAHGYWMRGLIRTTRSDLLPGLQDYERAAALFGKLGETEQAGRMRSSRADLFDTLGQQEEGWRERRRALVDLSWSRQHRLLQTTLQNSALASLQQNLDELALYFQDAVIRNAHAWERPAAVAEGYLYRSRIRYRLEDTKGAEEDLNAAREWAAKVSETSFGGRLAVETEQVHAEHALATRPGEAIEALDRAIAYFERNALEFRLPKLLLDRGRGHIARGNRVAAERDFLAGVRLYEGRKQSVPIDLRVAYFDNAADLFDELVAMRIDERDVDGALRYAERARTRPAADDEAAASVDQSTIGKRLPSGTTMLYLQLLPKKLASWVITPDRVVFRDTSVDAPALRRDVWHLRRAAGRTGAAVMAAQQEQLARLYELIVRPVADELPPNDTLIVVPDDVLADVPFGALWDSQKQQRFLQQRAFVVSPSATIAVAAAARAREARRHRDARLLFVAAPAGGSGWLPKLPGVINEARQVTAMYDDARLLDSLSGRDELLSLVRSFDIVHFAGHAISSARDARLSQLLLPSKPGGDLVALTGGDVKPADWERASLVILSACATASGPTSSISGTLSLARTFLEAGTPAVVASLWDVSDHTSTDLMTRFHAALVRTGRPAVALREAQLAVLGRMNGAGPVPLEWSAFQLYGAPVLSLN